jgi:hypothetical protein
MSPAALDEDLPNELTDTNKKYLSIIDQNNLRMTDDRIADFRATLSELIGVKNGVIPDDSQGILRSESIKKMVKRPGNSNNMFFSPQPTKTIEINVDFMDHHRSN